METGLQKIGSAGEIVGQAHYGYSKISGMEDFLKTINENPPENELKPTPDQQAKTLPISFVETKLDEIYVGQWGATELKVMVVGNEIVGNLVLWVIHPITGLRIERPGTAAAQITVDAVPDRIKFKESDSREEKDLKRRERNAWALDLQNKKPNALYLVAPKLRAEAIKNAAKSLGKIFGRDINREHVDTYESIYGDQIVVDHIREELEAKLRLCKTKSDMVPVWQEYEKYDNPELRRVFNSYRSKLNYQK